MTTSSGELPNFGVLSMNPINFKHEETPRTHPLHPTILSLRLLGRLPLTRTESGELYFNRYSWWTIYCLVSLAIQLGIAFLSLKDHFLIKERWSTFDSAVTSTMNAAGLLFTMLNPILFTWRNSQSIAEALNRWKNLQDSFRVVTANQVSSLLLDHPYFGVMLITSCFLLVEFIPIMLQYIFFAEPHDRLSSKLFILYFAALWYVKLLLWFWLVFTHSISQAARTLEASLAETMARDPSVRRLQQHRSLWLELNDYTCTMTAAVGGTVRAWLVTLVFSFYISLFASAMSFANAAIETKMIIPLMSKALQTFLLNNASYLADNQIGHDFIVKIFSFNYRDFSEAQLEEVELFLYTIENSPARFLLEQMVEPSRQTMLDILELSLTIMVVLLQFRVST